MSLAGCSGERTPQFGGDYPLIQLTDRVYVVQAPDATPSAANQGFSNNPAFVVTGKGVVVIDPGASQAVGAWLVKRIRSVTAEPIIAVINTHSDGNHWLANHAIKAAYPQAVIYAHAIVRTRIAGAGAGSLQRMNRATQGATQGTEVVPPEFELEHEEVLRLRQLHFRVYHAEPDQAGSIVELVEEGVLFMSDNSVTEQIKARLGRAPIKHLVPAHGVLLTPQSAMVGA